jgi:hypothetical protein
MEYLKIANSFGMWIACSIIVFIVIWQAYIFMHNAYATGKKMGLADEQLKSALRCGTISTIGPALAVVVAMISLIISLGAPFAWMRLSVVGSIPYELMAAEVGANVAGTSLGSPTYDVTAFATSIWTNTLGATGWLLICALFTDKFDILRRKAVAGKEELLPVLSVSAMIGAFAYFGAPYLAGRGFPSTVSFLTGAIVMVIINILADKMHTPRLKEWALGIAMFAGMAGAMMSGK